MGQQERLRVLCRDDHRRRQAVLVRARGAGAREGEEACLWCVLCLVVCACVCVLLGVICVRVGVEKGCARGVVGIWVYECACEW